MAKSGPILITGATGYVGGLVAASLLAESDQPLILLVRPGREPRDIVARLTQLAADRGGSSDPAATAARIRFFELPTADRTADLARELRPLGIQQIVHSAGCLDYFAEGELEEGNVALTRRMVELAGRLGSPRLIYVSTAFSSGYIDGPVPEAPNGEPLGGDPTLYTTTKRRAEHVVKAADVPWLVVRPSVVIGDSQTGRYDGKRYGLYQFWMGLERLLYDRKHDEMHVVAPTKSMNLVHQDSFQNAMMMLIERDQTEKFINIVSADQTSPQMRELWELWFSVVGRPRNVFYYDNVESISLSELHPRQRAFTMFAMTNMRIAAHPWSFEARALNGLKHEGLDFCDATLDSITNCQDRFIRNSSKMQRYMDRYGPYDTSAMATSGAVHSRRQRPDSAVPAIMGNSVKLAIPTAQTSVWRDLSHDGHPYLHAGSPAVR